MQWLASGNIGWFRMPSEFKHIVRIVNTDLEGTRKIVYALTAIKGIGIKLAKVIVDKANINPKTRVGLLSDAEIEKVTAIVKDLESHDFPSWLLNRAKDGQTGKNLHLIGSDLVLQVKTDIDEMKNIRSWKGFRHAYGLKVRGQRTKATGRTGKAIGVRVKKARARQ